MIAAEIMLRVLAWWEHRKTETPRPLMPKDAPANFVLFLHALLIELPDLDAVHTLYAVLRDDLPAGVADLVPAACTLLVILDPDAGATTAAVSEALQAAHPTRTRSSRKSARASTASTCDGSRCCSRSRCS